jgi:hypothetical protein
MSKIQWLINDAPSLPVSSFMIDPHILDGDVLSLQRKFDILRDEILMEFNVHVGFEIEIEMYTGNAIIHVVE